MFLWGLPTTWVFRLPVFWWGGVCWFVCWWFVGWWWCGCVWGWVGGFFVAVVFVGVCLWGVLWWVDVGVLFGVWFWGLGVDAIHRMGRVRKERVICR
ncbi:hypothetical protein RA265_27885, partial [Pseudomonas syringae pv. tagetis]|uniref:hypothetical protein n=1 Tax=Pseudomonas syringae group genomosp. 7 TaxID=251699 RepID=UPI00376FE70A